MCAQKRGCSDAAVAIHAAETAQFTCAGSMMILLQTLPLQVCHAHAVYLHDTPPKLTTRWWSDENNCCTLGTLSWKQFKPGDIKASCASPFLFEVLVPHASCYTQHMLQVQLQGTGLFIGPAAQPGSYAVPIHWEVC